MASEREPLAPESLEEPDEAFAEEGVAAFVKPPPLEVGKWEKIQFVVGTSDAKLSAEADGQALAASRAVYVAKMMRVTLLDDPNFDIKPKSEAVQDTGLGRSATWLWDVRPKVATAGSLFARVEVLRALPGGGYKTIDDFTRKVEVQAKAGALGSTLGAIDQAATVGDRLTKLFNSWQKTVTALIALVIAFGVLLWRLGLRKNRPAA